jgi:GTPase SAR1 family protein
MQFINQEVKLTVDNVDRYSSATPQESRHGPLLPNTIRALIVGHSGCGKTNLVFALLTNVNGIRFHNVYIYSKTLDQPKYKMLSDILKDIDGVQLFTFYDNEKVIPPEKALPNSVFIFDDIICENQNIVRSYFSRGRHNRIDVCYLAQSFSRVPKQLLRDNSNFIVLFKQDETNLKHVYLDHCSGDMKYSDFKDFCTSCWRKGRFEFVVISKDCERDNGRYRHGFDKFVII